VTVERWMEDLATVALVGTARRSLPPRPEGPADASGPWVARADAVPEVDLLDAVAVTGAWRRAAAVPDRREPTDDGAPDDVRPPPPPRARQLLDLLLTQPPVGARLAPYTLSTWLRAADDHGLRVHHPVLVPLLEKATAVAELRPAVRSVLDSRGAWLAAANPAWSWAATDLSASTETALAAIDQREWAQLPTLERVVLVRRLRAQDPGAARALIESTWSSDPAPARAELIGALGVGLSLDDEAFLERALDDRAAGVREAAYRLLDALPGSARAGRLGQLLTPLVSVSGLVRRRVRVELPTTPTAAAVRDGLVPAPPGRSARGFWLQRLAAGAPFTSWTEATQLDPPTVVRTLDDADALAGLRTAAVARRDPTWARALLDLTWDTALARCLPGDEVADRMLARVDGVKTVPDLTAALQLSPGPWDERASSRIVARLARLERPPHVLGELVVVLAGALHPSAAPALARLVPADAGPNDPLHQLVQHLSLVPTITEAFA